MLNRIPTAAISATILIVITLAATTSATSSAGTVSLYLSNHEDVWITDCMLAPDSSCVNSNVSDFFVENVSYHFGLGSSSGVGSVFVATAPEPSAMFRIASGVVENVSEEVSQSGLDEWVSVGGSVGSNQSDCLVGSDLENYADPPRTVVGHFFSGFGPSYFAALNEAKQYVADIAARKALLLNYSEFKKSEVNGGAGLVWEPIGVQISFHVRKTGDYWEAIQEDSQSVAFGGSEGVGGVSGSDGGAVLNAAINGASVAGGGRVTIGCGVLFADSIAPKSGVEVCGEGKGTVLRQNANANTIFIHSGEKIVNFSMHDLTIDYNHQNQSSPKEGMYIGHASEYLHFYRLWIENCKKFGIHLASLNQPNAPPISCENVKVEDIVFTDVVAENWDLCVVASHGGYVRNVTICGLHRNAGVVAFEGTNLLVTDCHVTIDRQDGYVVGGIWLGSCNYSICANNTVVGQTMNGDYETIGIRVNTEHDNMKPRDSYKNMVTDNNVSTIRHGIMLEETSDDYVVFNTLTDCANGVVFPNYGNPAAINPTIGFNSLNNVGIYILEFVTTVGLQQYFNNSIFPSCIP